MSREKRLSSLRGGPAHSSTASSCWLVRPVEDRSSLWREGARAVLRAAEQVEDGAAFDFFRQSTFFTHF